MFGITVDNEKQESAEHCKMVSFAQLNEKVVGWAGGKVTQMPNVPTASTPELPQNLIQRMLPGIKPVACMAGIEGLHLHCHHN